MNFNKALDELAVYVNADKFNKEHTIMNLKDFASYKEASPEAKEDIVTRMLNHRVAKSGICYKGYRVFLDNESLDLKVEDIHLVVIKVEAIRNKPVATATFNDNVLSVDLRNNSFRKNGTTPITLRLPANSIDDAFYHGTCSIEGKGEPVEITAEKIVFTPDSVEEFYGFKKTLFVKFTKSIVEKYWREDYSNLVRYNLNMTSHQNGWGLAFAVWSCTLIEPDWGTAYVDEDIREDEINALAVGHEDSWIIRDCRRKYKTTHAVDEEEKEKTIAIIKGKIEKIQKIVDENEEEILDFAIDRLNYPHLCASGTSAERCTAKKAYLGSNENRYGLDCGFLYFRFSDEENNEMVKEAADYGCDSCYTDGTFTLNIPLFCQSTTIQRAQAAGIAKLANEAGIPIRYNTVLD